MKYTIISASHRKGSNSFKTAQYIQKVISKMDGVTDCYLIDLAEESLPMWGEEKERAQKVWGQIKNKLSDSSALVAISPEWGGMATPIIKNFFLYCTNEIVGHKPCMIVSVSSGRSGSYPVSELRASSYKNNRICYIPDHVIVRDVDNVLNDFEKPSSENDLLIRDRIQYSCKVLNEYNKAFCLIRESKVIDFKNYANGM